MSSYVVWMDTEHAKLFEMAPEGVKERTVKAQVTGDNEKFYHHVAEELKGVKEFLLVGPGQGKEHFKLHLKKHHHGDLANKLLASENMDHPTDAQILAHARKFFKHAHLF